MRVDLERDLTVCLMNIQANDRTSRPFSSPPLASAEIDLRAGHRQSHPMGRSLDDIRIDFDCPRCGSTMVEAYGRLKASPLVQCNCGARITVEIEIGSDARRGQRASKPTMVAPQNDN
ncbi:MAG: hypothetical protein JWR80_4584 [Bradyrhizobium sp.]|nr:hypothetical protein [Bradyrhizobium sp.]